MSDPLLGVEKMIEYFYTMDYDTSIACEGDVEIPEITTLQLHAMMFALGDKYDVEGLRSLSAGYYAKALELSTPLEFLRSTVTVYTGTAQSTRTLRDQALKYAREKLPKAWKVTANRQVYESVAADAPDFIKELLDSYLSVPLIGKCSTCGPHQPMCPLQARCKSCGRGGASVCDTEERRW